MSTIEPPKVHYSVTIDAQIEGLTLPLQVHAESVNDLRKSIRLLQANGMLVPQCPVHHRAMKQNSRGWYCSAKNSDGEYCKERA